MQKIRTLKQSLLRNAEHAQFHVAIKDDINAETPLKLFLASYFLSYADALTVEEQAISVEKGSQFTKTVEDADLLRDQLYRSFVLQIQSAELNPENSVHQSATRILRILNQVGDMRKQPYNQESQTMKSLIDQLKEKYIEDVKDCHALGIMNKMEEANNDFIQLFGTRGEDVSHRADGDVRKARVSVDEIFRQIITIIEAQVLINGEENYKNLIEKINYHIDYYNNTVAIRRSGKKPPTETTDTVQ